MTIGTSIMRASFVFESFCFMFTCHTPPRRNAYLALERISKVVRVFCVTRTGDTENRGSFRCGFCFGFYRGPHPVSNERGPLPESVSSAGRGRQSRDSHRPPRPQFFP